MKKYYLLSTTEGCATNLLENSAYRQHYGSLGFEPSQTPEDADLILINTCAYNKAMEDRATSIISEYQNKYQGKEVIVAGCFPKINAPKLKSFFHGKVIHTNPRNIEFDRLHEFDESDFSGLSSKHQIILGLRPFYFAIEKGLGIKFQPLHNIFKSVVVNQEFFLITASTGCLGKCTFCAIKRAKGSLKSRPLQTLISEFDSGLQSGKRDFWLLGDDIGCWGEDVGLSISDLLTAFLAKKSAFSLVLNYLDPHYLVKNSTRLIELLSDPRIIGVNITLQSGSSTVLERMARNYDPEIVYSHIRKIKKLNPGLAIKTNIIVGFPGESWADFCKSLYSVFQFDAVLAMKFAARPHTPAEKYPNQIPETIKTLRHLIINGIILVRHGWIAIYSLFSISFANNSRETAPAENLRT